MSVQRWGRRARRRWTESWRAVAAHPRRMAQMALPWLLGFCTVFPLVWYEMERAVQGPERQAGRDEVDQAAQSMLRWMERLRDDTRFLADLTPRLLDAGSGPDSPLMETYTAFLLAGGDYHKVRWIDSHGMERLRIDQDGGRISSVPQARLQDKRGRPFFEQGLVLAPGQVHLSPLDLNVENGRIEQPLRPTLRASAPFLHTGGSGVVVVNFHGRVLLDRLQVQAAHSGFELYLVNPEGYWLLGPEPGDAWGWQLGRPERRAEQRDPRLWQAMLRQSHGTHGDWSFSSLEAAWDGSEGDLLAYADPSLGQLRLLVRRQAPVGARWKVMLAGLGLVAAVLIVLALLGQARGLEREAAYVRRLRRANQALLQANERLQLAQDELARAQRLSSLGLMVAGVAHEMNTPLGSARLALSTVRNGVSTLERQVQTGLRRSELDTFLAAAHDACALADAELRRTSALVQRFKQVAVDRASRERRRFELGEILLDADPRLRRGEPVDGVGLELDLEPDVVMDTYPGPLEQVVSNLLSNALAHGYPDGGPGWVRIRAISDGPAHAFIEVADGGRGIAAQDLPRIFEPFFTTRRNRGGTGLGLHIVHQIVTEVLGGTVTVRSQPAGGAGDGTAGTVFTVHSPRTGPARPPSAR